MSKHNSLYLLVVLSVILLGSSLINFSALISNPRTKSEVYTNITYPRFTISEKLDTHKTHMHEAANYNRSEDIEIAYKGVSFTYNPLLASAIETKTIPAFPLENSTDKPDGVAPKHISFVFTGSYASKYKSLQFSPEINIYPIAEYKKMFEVSNDQVLAFEREIQKLQKIISEQPTSLNKEIPVLPWLDETQAIRAHIKYINFKNGKGVFFLTQYNVEPALVNNQGLVYLFQGITDDGLYYVSASFPVTAPILPKDFETTSYKDYQLPNSFYKNYDSNKQRYQSYLNDVEKTLNVLPPKDFEPQLSLFDELIESFYVKIED